MSGCATAALGDDRWQLALVKRGLRGVAIVDGRGGDVYGMDMLVIDDMNAPVIACYRFLQ